MDLSCTNEHRVPKQHPVVRCAIEGIVSFFEQKTAYDIGYAHAFKKPLIIVQEKGNKLNLMISESLTYYTQSAEELATYDFTQLKKNIFTVDVF